MRRFQRLTLSAALAFLPIVAHAQLEITLKNDFIADFSNRATIDATFTVDKAHPRPNTPKKDADLHIAGRAPEIGLATVAEIMNAAGQKAAVDRIHEVEGTNETVHITGAWRLWAEHGGGDPQVQGKKLTKFTTTNPDHVFEIHPITRVDDVDTGGALAITGEPIAGFRFKDAETAFQAYENIRCKIAPGKSTTKLTTGMAGFNYVEFRIRLIGDPIAMADGEKAFASVLDLDGEMLVRKRRMIFLKGTPPEQAVQGLHDGDELHVVGVPRLNLAILSWRLQNAKKRPEVLDWNLPYEMIVVGVISENGGS